MKIIVVDDHPIVRNGLKLLLESEPGWEIAGLAGNGADAIRLVRELEPDVAIVDLDLPDISGLSVAEEIRNQFPKTRVVILSMHKNDYYVQSACRKGVSAYVSKHDVEEEIVKAVLAASRGKKYPADLCKKRLQGADGAGYQDPSSDVGPELSGREYQVLHLLAKGCHNKDVAGQLSISVRTAEKHRASLMAKLNLRNQAELIHYALHNNIIRMP